MEFHNQFKLKLQQTASFFQEAANTYDCALQTAQSIVDRINSNADLQNDSELCTDDEMRRKEIVDRICQSLGVKFRRIYLSTFLMEGEDAFSSLVGQFLALHTKVKGRAVTAKIRETYSEASTATDRMLRLASKLIL